jgi:hypothetical protein
MKSPAPRRTDDLMNLGREKRAEKNLRVEFGQLGSKREHQSRLDLGQNKEHERPKESEVLCAKPRE